MDAAWSVHGMCTILHEICIVYEYYVHGICVAYAYYTHGICRAYACNMQDTHMDFT